MASSSPGGTASTASNFHCASCNLNFSKRANLTRHRRNVHLESIARTRASQTCPLCRFEYQSRAAYARHLAMTHDSALSEERHEFASIEAFHEWKRQVERRTLTSFVRNTAKKSTRDGLKTYYICCRKGRYKSESKGKKVIKQQGSRKINSSCPAAMTVLESAAEGATVRVVFVSTHVGHDNELAHLDLSKSERAQVADQISLGLSADLILSNFRNGQIAHDSQRVKLLKKRDINNIARDFKLDIRKHEFELSVIDHWAGLLDGGGVGNPSPLLCYKPRGTVDARYEELRDDDFVLGVMNETQQSLLVRYGARLVCLDCNDGASGTVRLVSLLVVNENDEGVASELPEGGSATPRALPVAHMVAGRLDTAVLLVFLRCVRQRVGTIAPEVLMCGGGVAEDDIGPADDDGNRDVFYDAWCQAMGEPRQKWLCGWQVSATWEGHLKGMPKDVARNARRKMEALVREPEHDAFEPLLRKTLEELVNCRVTTDFARHLVASWVPLAPRWANCYRTGALAIASLGLEPVHRELRHRFVAATANGRRRRSSSTLALHAVLAEVMWHARDTLLAGGCRLVPRPLLGEAVLERLQAAGVARHTRCEAAVGLQLLRGADEQVWVVEEGAAGADVTNTRQVYEVTVKYRHGQDEATAHTIDSNCPLACPCCHACVHMYVCNCLDYVLCFNVCIHLHAVATVALDLAASTSPHSQLSLARPPLKTDAEEVNRATDMLASTIAVASVGHDDVIVVEDAVVESATPGGASDAAEQYFRLQQEVVTSMNELIQDCETLPQLEELRRLLEPARTSLAVFKAGENKVPEVDGGLVQVKEDRCDDRVID